MNNILHNHIIDNYGGEYRYNSPSTKEDAGTVTILNGVGQFQIQVHSDTTPEIFDLRFKKAHLNKLKSSLLFYSNYESALKKQIIELEKEISLLEQK